MKIIFYKTLLYRAKNVTPNEKILYSFLVSKSLMLIDDVFNQEIDGFDFTILEKSFNCDIHWFEMCSIKNSKIADELNMSRPTIINGIKKLIKYNYIKIGSDGKYYIFINKDLIMHGYFELKHMRELVGESLILYSFLCDKGKRYNYTIDTYESKMAGILDKSISAIKKLISTIKKHGLIERQKDGKLKIIL